MHDLNVKFGGPRDQANQNISFNVHYIGNPDAGRGNEDVTALINQLRLELRKERIPDEDFRRVERNLATIEDEAKSKKPALKDVENSLGSIGRILESLKTITPTAINVFRGLAAALGFSI